jgi:hypothetical protein
MNPQVGTDEDDRSTAYSAAARLVASEALPSEAEVTEEDRQRTKGTIDVIRLKPKPFICRQCCGMLLNDFR